MVRQAEIKIVCCPISSSVSSFRSTQLTSHHFFSSFLLSYFSDPTSLLELDLQVAAASRRVVITMELMQEQELKKQLTSGSDDKTPSEVE